MFKFKTFVRLFSTSVFLQNQSLSTIFALSSGVSRSAIAVLRVSGPASINVLTQIARLNEHRIEPRKALLRKIFDPENGELLDKCIIIWFPGPNSYTGEDSVELHLHGGVAVINSVLDALCKLPGFQMAEPGEFTKRAFLAGKLDATEVEGLSNLLQAETESQRRQALRLASGELAELYQEWRSSIINCMANLEAFVDFGEDQDIGSDVLHSVENSIKSLSDKVKTHLNDNRRGERLRHGVKVAIIGQPNVGKSSLLNLLSRRRAAIVSPYAGTTRDVLEISLDVGGYPIILCDTAGLRISEDPVEKEGQSRAKETASTADLVILVIDASTIKEPLDPNQLIEIECKKLDLLLDSSTKVIVLINKVDLVQRGLENLQDVDNFEFISCKTEQGLVDFMELFKTNLSVLCSNQHDSNPAITSSRQRFHVTLCLEHLENLIEILRHNGDLALGAEELRKAAKQIGYLTGKIFTEEVLDTLFRSFCIGK